jgi:Flp pilus assembly protein protease CpaA
MIVYGLHAVVWAIALMALLASAYTDVKDRIIPNELVGLVAACGLALSLITRPELAWIGALAAVLALFALGTLAHYGLMGGGDVKMIAAATLLFHPAQIGTLLLFIVMAGGVLSCIYIAVRYALRKWPAGFCDPHRGASTDAGRPLSHRERVGVRGDILSIGHNPSPCPSPPGRGDRRRRNCHFRRGLDPDGQGWLAVECARIATGGPMPYGVAIFAGVAGLLAGETPRCLPADFCFF